MKILVVLNTFGSHLRLVVQYTSFYLFVESFNDRELFSFTD